jgi:hypothetical protein
MFETDFEKVFKRFEALSDQTKQAYEFWAGCITSSWKEFFKIK